MHLFRVLVHFAVLVACVRAVDDYVQSPPFVQRFLGFSAPNCYAVELVVPTELQELGAKGDAIPTRQIEFVPNNNDFSLARELGFMAPTVWELFGDFKSKLYATDIGKRATITKWSCGKTLLKIGTGNGDKVPLLPELKGGVGTYFRFCTEELKQPMVLESCSVVATPRDQSGGHNDRREVGTLIDVQSLEWILRGSHETANADVESDTAVMRRFVATPLAGTILSSFRNLHTAFYDVRASLEPFFEFADLRLSAVSITDMLQVSAKVKKDHPAFFEKALKHKAEHDDMSKAAAAKIVPDPSLAKLYETAVATVKTLNLEQRLDELEQDIAALW